MPTALTIFGIGKPANAATLCYAFLRPVRGPGEYPAPTLPETTPVDGIRRTPMTGFDGLDLVTWDTIYEEVAASAVQTALDGGRFSIPPECPIEPGASISGQPFGPVIILESPYRVAASGSGVLYAKGIAIDDVINRMGRSLDGVVGAANTPAVLAKLLDLVAEQSGIGEIFKARRRIGAVEQFYRAQNAWGTGGPLFDVAVDKPDLRGRDPVRRVRIRRHAAALDQLFRLHVTLKNFDEIIKDVLVDIPAGQSELPVDADFHITDVVLTIFDSDGRIADHLSGAFCQGMNFGITARGRVDELPPVLPGRSSSTDLEKRARISTVAFSRPPGADRSGGFDALRRNRERLGRLIGVPDGSRENVWFEYGGESQIEVIRWIKAKLEKPGVAKAYLVDPYLGSEALQRVVARQGNENITLTILVSPGGIDPDADAVETRATGDHLSKLVATANEWSARLCGRISIYHIQRGDGARQAFHDRYLSIVDQQGVPTVFLLSNSLSKAAGAWPFAICELDRVLSWKLQAHILALIDGTHGGRDLRPAVIWQSGEPAIAGPPVPQAETEAPPDDARPDWVKSADRLLQDLWTVVIQNLDYEQGVGEKLDAFMKSWPPAVDATALAKGLFRTVGHRDEVVVFVSSRLDEGTAEQRDVARRLDEKLLDRFLSNLPQAGQQATSLYPFRNRDDYLRRIAQTIATRDSPTNFVRAELNPTLHALVQLIETQRFEYLLSGEALEGGVCLASVGLEVAIASENARTEHRTGLAADYIHWLGRLTRSDAAQSRFGLEMLPGDIARDDLNFAAGQVLAARSVLGEKLDEPIQRVRDDPLVLPAFREALAGVA